MYLRRNVRAHRKARTNTRTRKRTNTQAHERICTCVYIQRDTRTNALLRYDVRTSDIRLLEAVPKRASHRLHEGSVASLYVREPSQKSPCLEAWCRKQRPNGLDLRCFMGSGDVRAADHLAGSLCCYDLDHRSGHILRLFDSTATSLTHV
jgi:hypothetical protein